MDFKNPTRPRAPSTKEHVIWQPSRRPSLQDRTVSSPAENHDKSVSLDTSDRTKSVPRPLNKISHGTEDRRTSNRQTDPSKTDLPAVNLAIVGAEGVGKSTFIQCALDLKRPPISQSSAKKMSLEGLVYIVSLWEVSVTEITVDKGRGIIWPQCKADQTLPPLVDGVLVIFDATSPESLVETSDMLNVLAASGLPFTLVACKCDVSYPPGRPDPAIVEKATQIIRRFDPQETSWEGTRSQKKCISLVLRSIISKSSDLSREPPSTPRILSGLDHGNSNHSIAGSSTYDRHHRRVESAPPGNQAKSQNVVSRYEVDGAGVDRVPSDSANDVTVALDGSNSRNDRKNPPDSRPQTPPPTSDPNTLKVSPRGRPDTSPSHQNALRTTWRISASSDAFNSFLDMEEEADSGASRPGSSSEQSIEKTMAPTPTDPGYTFDQLVDRLIGLPLSKQDNKFTETFLCLYRKFAPPLRLLNTLISRFEEKERGTLPQLTRASEQLQLLSIVAQWTAEYPGDFAHPRTRRRIKEFLNLVDRNHVYMFAAKEISMHLDISVEDDDVGWPFNDEDDESTDSEDALLTSVQSLPTPICTNQGPFSDDLIHRISTLDLGDDGPDLSSQNSGTLSNSSSLAARSDSTLTYSATMHAAYEDAQRKARQLSLTPKFLLSKIQWRLFMDIPDDDFARELTRIDWIMFTSFRPRDLVRHVSISGKDKDKIKSLENVNRMIKEFNHLAFFVASMILLRDKPKHRAKALEKFMGVAQKLRRLNNYNSLGAVIAGINGTPVQRLLLTKDLVPPSVQKDFLRLIILMGTQKGHSAYRLAWENSFGERIPFLPLHRRDLVSAEEGNRTYVGENGERINWRKFDIMGEVVMGVQRSQRTPYPMIQRYDELTRLVLDTKPMRDEEDLYSRSMQVEPSGGIADPLRNKKFGWLRT